MNKKLIAAAVSAAVVAPVAAYGEVTVYGRINNAIDLNDLAGDSKTDLSGVSSRFGVKYNKDMGNGFSAHGKYEFSTSSDKEEEGINDIRVATVGISGPFGRIDAGNQWSAYSNTFGTLVSPTYTLGYYLYSSVGGGTYRSSNTIKYSNSFGPVYLALDVRLNESDEGKDVAEKIRGDGVGLGLSFAVTDNITIAAAFDREDGAAGTNGTPFSLGTAREGTKGRDAFTVTATDVTAGRRATLDEVRPGITSGDTIDNIFGDGVVLHTATAAEEQSEIVEGQLLAETDSVPAITESDDYKPEKTGGFRTLSTDTPDTDRVGLAVKANFGGFWASLGWQNIETDDDERTVLEDDVDIDTFFIYGGGSIGEKTSWLVGYSKADDGEAVTAVADDPQIEGDQSRKAANPDDSEQLTWGVYHNLGGGLKLYYEATDVDSENSGNDGARHLIGMRVDF